MTRPHDPTPFVAKGFDFPGCSDWAGPADNCTCETWSPVVCPVCAEPIRDGDTVVDLATTDALYPPPAAVAAGEWPEADLHHLPCVPTTVEAVATPSEVTS